MIMLELSELELKILNLIPLEERDVRKLGRILQDVSLVTGMTEDEIIDFIPFGLEDEIHILKIEYNFNNFKKALVSKLTKKSYSPPGLSSPIPETVRQTF
ncbi:hypothetical protein GS518_08925 [Leptospira interrogans]|uniref:Uncharacterized protein n=18 Tax=Leptospira interrogans TaxID=173 RepID=Q8F4C0_LEPIN|nr:hypothetical protein LA_2121 [Leptospira interrogans serovar Lai str. 56601]AAS70386.1 conserved hypothetical protein [Leptospira interrogans serovar Copenhageni str. Fiocruz L1-130]ALE39402.1 hypothetical protein G436_2220 [Leptospira interrogans serovar Hardjo str. Norma]ARB94587.1 hypothetical protein A6J42_02440 [Leptospira interrogans serovar Copenhageni]ASP42247.1 hypothetical protein AMR47_12330 [Leptospira interrogans]ASV05910.1 hypothetical protein B2G47_07705 [Leptospira interroga